MFDIFNDIAPSAEKKEEETWKPAWERETTPVYVARPERFRASVYEEPRSNFARFLSPLLGIAAGFVMFNAGIDWLFEGLLVLSLVLLYEK